MGFRLILFDLDDTLFDHIGAVESALAETSQTYPELATRPLSEVVAENLRVIEEIHPRVLAGNIDVDAARRERMLRLFKFCGSTCTPEQAERVAMHYWAAYRRNRRTTAGAREVLEFLRGRATVGIVSNNLAAEQAEKLKLLRLSSLVDFVLTSEDAGVTKPQPEIYLRALVIGGASAAETVFVGDAWEADVVGPMNVGIAAVWLSRGRVAPAAPQPFAVIRTLPELPAVLEA